MSLSKLAETIQLEEVEIMTDARARIATTIPAELDIAVRQMAAEHRTAISAVVTAFLGYANAHKEDAELIGLLEVEIAELKEQRAEVGRRGMASRYGKEET